MMYYLAAFSVLVLVSSLVSGRALPSNLDLRESTESSTENGPSAICSDVQCLEGRATMDTATGVCVCPQWAGENPDDPCSFMTCPEATIVHYSSTTNQCICKLEYVSPVLVQDARDEAPEQNGTLYSALPYFPDGVITYMFQFSGGSWTLNASTTIAADGIGTDPEPNLVLVPKYMVSRAPKPIQETALIIAVHFNDNETITYHVQLNDGRVVKLYGDQYVHQIDRMDPNKPPNLSLVTSQSIHHLKRDVLDHYEEADPQTQAASAAPSERGVEDVSSYTATVSQETCQSITCLNNGGKPAQFNPFLNSCYCQTLVPPEHSPGTKLKRSANEDSLRSDMDDSTRRPLRPKPSSKTCRYLIACPGESQPYFNQETSQCLCVVYRTGFERPVIASDASIFPRAAEVGDQNGEEIWGEDDEAVSHRLHPKTSVEDYCFVHPRGRQLQCEFEVAWDREADECYCYDRPSWPWS